MERRKVCRYFERGACRKDNCPFVHLRENRKACIYYMEGNCNKGAKCNFYHPPRESEKLASLKEELKKKNTKKFVPKEGEESDEEYVEECTKEEEKVEKIEQKEEIKEEAEKVEYVEEVKPEKKVEEKVETPAKNEEEDEIKHKMNRIDYFLSMRQEESESSEEEEEQIVEEKPSQIQFVKIFLKKFPDFSKTPDFKAQVLKNEQKYFKGEKYLTLINKITDPIQKQYYQIIRKFTDSFLPSEQEPKRYSIRIRPMLYDKEINLHFDFLQDTFNLDIDSTEYPQKRATFKITNPSIPQQYKQKIEELINKIHSTRSVFETLKAIQNNFQKIYEESKFRLENQFYSKKQNERRLKEEKINNANKGAEGDRPEQKKKKKVKRQPDDQNPDVSIIRYKEGERVQNLNFNYEITVESIVLQACEYVVVQKLLTYIECVCEKKIMYILDVTKDRSLTVGIKLQCKKCQNIIMLGLEREVIQGRKDVLGRMGVNNGHLIDLGGVGFKIGCSCNNEISKGKLYLPGERINANCHNCFQSMMVAFMGLKIYNPTLKIHQVKTDRQLPNKGTCKHVKLSYRWFRFGCCGRCFSCDDCHIMQSVAVHNKIKGITMLCGFCSREQPISNDCLVCHKQVVKGVDKSGHWEGGMGCRDQTLLSKKDPKKYTGLSKKK